MSVQFKHESATATARPLDACSYLLMNVRANFKRQGHATEMMHLICRWADENRALLYLEARVFELGGIPTNEALAEWYSQFGFKPSHQPREMMRYPREKYMSSSEKDELAQPG